MNVGTFAPNGIDVQGMSANLLAASLANQSQHLSNYGAYGTVVKLPGAKEVTYASQWHGKFSKLSRKVFGHPPTPVHGAATVIPRRTEIFQNIIEIVNLIREPRNLEYILSLLAGYEIYPDIKVEYEDIPSSRTCLNLFALKI